MTAISVQRCCLLSPASIEIYKELERDYEFITLIHKWAQQQTGLLERIWECVVRTTGRDRDGNTDKWHAVDKEFISHRSLSLPLSFSLCEFLAGFQAQSFSSLLNAGHGEIEHLKRNCTKWGVWHNHFKISHKSYCVCVFIEILNKNPSISLNCGSVQLMLNSGPTVLAHEYILGSKQRSPGTVGDRSPLIAGPHLERLAFTFTSHLWSI